MPNTFYSVSKLTLAQKAEIMREAHRYCIEWHADLLDCNISWSRIQQDVTFDYIMSQLTDTCHTVVIHRKYPMDHGEVGFGTLGDPGWFLFITLDTPEFLELISKFKLKAK